MIGGGIAGLATACLLAHHGVSVTLLERNEELGGRVGRIRRHGFTFDTGPTLYLMDEAFDHFFSSVGTSTEAELSVRKLDPAYRVFPEGAAAFDVPRGVDRVADLFESLEPGAGARLRDYLDGVALAYRMSLRYFLYTNFTAVRPYLRLELVRRLPLLLDLLVTPLDRWVARSFSDPRLRQVLSYHSVFLSNRPSHTPALYELISHTDLVQGVGYPTGGMAAVTDALVRLAGSRGVNIRTSCEVTAITQREGAATGVIAGEQLRADAVIATVDRMHARELLEAGRAAEGTRHAAPGWPRGVGAGVRNLLSHGARRWPGLARVLGGRRLPNPGISTVLAYLGVRGELPELAHHQLLLSRDWERDFTAIFDASGVSRSIYACRPTATEPGLAPEGREALYLLIPVAADESIGSGSAYRGTEPGDAQVERIVDDAIELLAERAAIPDLAGRIVSRTTLGPRDFANRYCSYRGGALGWAHTLWQSAFLRGSNASRLRGLYYAGATATPGVGVPMCLISAENVLKRMVGDTSPGPGLQFRRGAGRRRRP